MWKQGMVSEKLLTVFEAEELTGRKASTWRRDILRKRIPYVKIGRQVRIPKEVIIDLMNKGIPDGEPGQGYHPAVTLKR